MNEIEAASRRGAPGEGEQGPNPEPVCQQEPPKLLAWHAAGATLFLIIATQFLPRSGSSGFLDST